MALVLAMCASVLGDVAPEYDTVMMLGPFESGKVRTVLWCLAVVTLGLAVLVPLTIILLWPQTWWGDGLAVLLWIPALPFAGIVLLVTGFEYSTQPEVHRFAVDDHEYLLASRARFAAEYQTDLDLYEKDGHLYRRVGPRFLGVADTNTFNRQGFSLDRGGGNVWLVYPGSDGETERVRIP